MLKLREAIYKKAKLIFEFNKKTPLFAMAAQSELLEKRIEKTLKILADGINEFPYYSTGYLVLSAALSDAALFNLAEEAVERAFDVNRSETTRSAYLNIIEEKRNKEIREPSPKLTAFVYDAIAPLLEKPVEVITLEEPNEPENESFEDKLIDIARSIEIAKIERLNVNEDKPEEIENSVDDILDVENEKSPIELDDFEEEKPDEDEEDAKEPELVSETLANIYLSQGNFKEALKVYEKLIKIYPNKKKYYKDKIIEIKSQLDDTDWA